jgi:hypothetical protein
MEFLVTKEQHTLSTGPLRGCNVIEMQQIPNDTLWSWEKSDGCRVIEMDQVGYLMSVWARVAEIRLRFHWFDVRFWVIEMDQMLDETVWAWAAAARSRGRPR